jgi:hypothetical protein
MLERWDIYYYIPSSNYIHIHTYIQHTHIHIHTYIHTYTNTDKTKTQAAQSTQSKVLERRTFAIISHPDSGKTSTYIYIY